MKKTHQHFIPQTYLKKFSNHQDGKTYFVDVFDKTAQKYISNMSVTNICVETDLYTLNHLEGDKKYSLENFFAENIENKYPSIYKLLVEEKRAIISADERTFILLTTLSMYFRTPKVLNQLMKFTEKLIKDVKDNTDAKFIDFMGYKISIDGKSFSEIKKEIRETNRVNYIETQFALLHEFVKFRAFDGLVVIELIGEQEFVTSDNPVEIRNSNAQGFNLFDIRNSIYIPLDPKHALFIAPQDKDSIINEVFYQKDNFALHITLNHSVFENAERWIIGTKKGLEQFLKDNEEYTKPANDDHPMLLEFQEKIELITNILALAQEGASNKNTELIKSLKDLKQNHLFQKHIDLQHLYEKFREAGLNI